MRKAGEVEMMTVQEAISCLEGVLCGAELLETDVDDITDLLREREAVEPKRGFAKTQKAWFCGACGFRLNREGRFCSKCGRQVKWE